MHASEAIEVLIARLMASEESGWSAWTPGEVAKRLSQFRGKQALASPEKLDLSVLLAPTGPIQEIAMSIGWHDE